MVSVQVWKNAWNGCALTKVAYNPVIRKPTRADEYLQPFYDNQLSAA